VIIGVLNSVVSVYYYFRVMVVMYMREPSQGEPDPEPINHPVMAIIALCAVAVFWLGIQPTGLLHLASNSVLTLK
jgi:NADH-quinone oxidoreductase subunit N